MILAFGMLASIVGIMAALDHNLINEMRNEAIKIAQEQEEAARNMPYSNLPPIDRRHSDHYEAGQKGQVHLSR